MLENSGIHKVITLDRLPHDILDHIVTEAGKAHFPTICMLRLVSKAMNAAAEPKAFQSMTIDFLERFSVGSWHPLKLPPLSAVTQNQLISIASSLGRRNPNARWTKRLVIPCDGLLHPIDDDEWSPYNKLEIRQHREMLNCQQTYLVPAILALKNVRRVNYNLSGCRPYKDVLHALTQLPRLEELAIAFFDSGWIFRNPQAPSLLPLFGFNHLRVLELSKDFLLCPPMISAIAHAISCSRLTLETLILLPEKPDWCTGVQGANTMYIDEIFNNMENQHRGAPCSFTPTEHKRLPRLSKLILNGGRFKLRELAAPFLSSLVHFKIYNSSVPKLNAKPSFWGALTRTGIHLEYLAVYPVTHALVNYLTSYTGLRELHLGCDAEKPEKFIHLELPVPLFTQVLPGQSGTLRHLSFSSLRWEAWAVREEYLEGILECKNLEILDLLYYFPKRVRPGDSGNEAEEPLLIDLSTLLSRISDGLQNLQQLRLTPARDISSFNDTFSLKFDTFKRDVAEEFGRSICEARICTATFSIPTFTLCAMPLLAFGSSFHPFDFAFDFSFYPVDFTFDASTESFKKVAQDLSHL